MESYTDVELSNFFWNKEIMSAPLKSNSYAFHVSWNDGATFGSDMPKWSSKGV